jgi:hypothetical protein
MIANPPARATLEKRPAFWAFERLDTFRPRIIQRAGRLIRPQGQLTLSTSANTAVQEELFHYVEVASYLRSQLSDIYATMGSSDYLNPRIRNR